MFAASICFLSVLQSRDSEVSFRSEDLSVSLKISKQTGRFSINWGKNIGFDGAFGYARIGKDSIIRSDHRNQHIIESCRVKDSIGPALRVIVRHLTANQPELRHTFWLYNKNGEVGVRLDVIDPKGQNSNQLVPISTENPIRFPKKGELQSLFVPYDNDGYARYSSQAWSGDSLEIGSHEIGALYDDSTRNGIVAGSIDHDIWKSCVKFSKRGGVELRSGVTSKYTHDTQPHGSVSGKEIRSARFVLGSYADWRKGLERHADLNAKIAPPLKWKGSVPFGWNSWSGHKSKLQSGDAHAALEFVRDQLPHFRNDGTAYINLDSYYDNLSVEQRQDFAKKAHASGLKAGVYWSPFVNWGEPDWKTTGSHLFRELQLKDSKGNLLPKHDGAWPLDPTHPGTLQRIDQQLKEFVEQGFDYVKLDFLTHGALEGKHYESRIQTGTAAYNFGMKRLIKSLERHSKKKPFFVSLSIAPLFPHGYGHSRRISCDVFADIGATEYLLNSQNYGWWSAGRLYQFNDPDHSCVYQAEGESAISEAESRSRLTASVIGGGLLLQGDNLSNELARNRVKSIFSNTAIIDLAKSSPQFRPVKGNIGSVGGDLFVFRESPTVCYIVAFNFDKVNGREIKEDASRLGLEGNWIGQDLWTNRRLSVTNNFQLDLAPMDCVLVRLNRKQ